MDVRPLRERERAAVVSVSKAGRASVGRSVRSVGRSLAEARRCQLLLEPALEVDDVAVRVDLLDRGVRLVEAVVQRARRGRLVVLARVAEDAKERRVARSAGARARRERARAGHALVHIVDRQLLARRRRRDGVLLRQDLDELRVLAVEAARDRSAGQHKRALQGGGKGPAREGRTGMSAEPGTSFLSLR